MTTHDELYAMLRNRLLGEMHLGRLNPGDRLPSMREVARESGVDHRVVARAYRALADDGLVEVRGRSGVVVALRSGTQRVMEERVAQWLSGVLTEAWTHRVGFRHLPDLVKRAAAAVRCACVESTEDHEVAICTELSDDFGLDVTALRPHSSDGGEEGDTPRLERGLADVDLVVTTAFHASEVAPIAARLSKPMIIVRVNPVLRHQIVNLLHRRGIRVVIADPAYAQRAREYMRGFEEGSHYHLVMADDPEAREALAEPEQAMFTRAARRRLGVEEYHLLPVGAPFLSAETAREISDAMVRLNLATRVSPAS